MYRASNIQNYRNNKDIWLPGKLHKIPLQCWNINIQPTGLEYLTDFLWSRNFEGLFHFVLVKFNCSFLLCLACPVWTVYCQQSRQGQFLTQMTSFVILKANCQTVYGGIWCLSSFFEVNWYYQKDMCFTVLKSLMLLKYLKCHIL